MRNVVVVRQAIVAAVVAGAVGPAGAAERPWVEVRSPHFVVASNAGEGEARDTAFQFEQVRSVFNYRHATLAWPSRGGDFVPIVRDLEAAARLSPDYAEAHAWLAHARVETGALPAAIESARKAVALEPGQSGHHRALARALAYAGQHAEAMVSVQRAITLSGNDRDRADAEELKTWIQSASGR